VEKYRIKEDEANMLSDFLLPMLSWNHETRASAQQMLNHPWLNMQDNYDFKYTDREYDVMMLKKELKNQMRGGASTTQDAADTEERQEMNELIESDPELYAADTENKPAPKRSEREEFKAEMMNGGVTSTEKAMWADLFNEDEISLEDPEEAREHLQERKAKECKIHNSFTGPYPLDPTEFSHTDKGENMQFTTLVNE